MTMKEFHDTLFELLDVDTWDPPKIALFEKEMGTLFKKVWAASLHSAVCEGFTCLFYSSVGMGAGAGMMRSIL